MHDHADSSWWRSRTGIAVIGFALIAAFYVLREHYAHVLGVLPYLLLLACPLMHLFMHHGHGGHAGHGEARDDVRPGVERGGSSSFGPGRG
ncbi:Hypothetical protein RMHFA_02043 [Roseomonas mucosa]|jgi:peptidoglycan/LPS O-acetylase OafA/YrhL|uniref:Protein of uncharacterized function (DUF2933) n=3 Tax=Roseomonas TaxID=125216 RepID=A0A1S8D0S3_9PROT|nr:MULTISPECIES: DUF2933 domain-containing protein [Acetobacteraceae]MBS5905245.1 DUF2933 domain-containing protein [Acetobacteraceae bacterium]HWL81625.1 DUF2933 domain-containing protein [Roseomonas sp.]APT57328.1 hypothetical protein RGI145_09650 [Roseomonas gilardii]ATR20223.1 DUF2933 domain-containing protein [Roseomonas sp. FDAARGOS_362]MCG7350286.1 DUF2933 domain-containing protein [Roseomonas mucosa]